MKKSIFQSNLPIECIESIKHSNFYRFKAFNTIEWMNELNAYPFIQSIESIELKFWSILLIQLIKFIWIGLDYMRLFNWIWFNCIGQSYWMIDWLIKDLSIYHYIDWLIDIASINLSIYWLILSIYQYNWLIDW